MIRLTFFGSPPSLGVDSQSPKPIKAQPKRIGLLAYLVLARDGSFTSREELLEVFWPADHPDLARSSLRTALHALRSELGETGLLKQGNSSVGIERKHVSSDVTEFRSAIQAGAFAEALALFRGEFLAGLHLDGASGFQSWLEHQRSEHTALASGAALQLAKDEHSRSNFSGIIFWLRRAESFLGRDERISAQLMAVLANMGNIPAALHEYAELTSWMRTHVDAEPSAATRKLGAQIKDGIAPSLDTFFSPRATLSTVQRPELRQSGAAFVARGGVHPLHLRDLVELADDVIYRADNFGYIMYTNPAGTRMLGLPLGKIIGRVFTDFVRADYRRPVIEFYLRQVHENTESTYFEFPLVRKDGEIRWVGQRVQLVRNEGALVGIQAIARDITASRLAERIELRLD